MIVAIWTANILGWPIIHLAIAWIVIRLPVERFARDGVFWKARSWEQDGNFYRKWLAIQRWKSTLPDGAPWVGGFSKKRLIRRDAEYLHTFILETRRAECAHWCMMLCLPVFFLWNPPWACAVMTAYGVTANMPCILVQRYNRLTLTRMLNTVQQRSESAVAQAGPQAGARAGARTG